MTVSLLFIIYSALFGFTLLRQCAGKLHLAQQFIWSTIGVLLQTFIIFLFALALPSQDAAIVLGVFATGIYTAYYWSLDAHRLSFAKDWQCAKKQITKQAVWPVAAVAIPWLTYALCTIPLLLTYKNGDLYAGWINVWGDWAVHLRSSTFFAQHRDLSLENPLYAGERFHYPYLSSYLASLLQRMNTDSSTSLVWPTFYFFTFLPLQLYAFALRLTKNRMAGVFFVYIVLLAGGGGVIHLINDLMSGSYATTIDPIRPLLYTDWGRIDGQSSNRGIWFMNFIMSEFIPQRAFLAGIAPALFIFQAIFTISWKLDNQTTKQLILAGILYGLLPLIHTHSFLAISLAWPIYLLVRAMTVKDWRGKYKTYLINLAYLLIPAIILGSILLFGFVFDGHESFIKPLAWWLPQTDKPSNPLLFWLWNAGPLILLIPIAYSQLPKFRPLILTAAALWLFGNFIRWQPWQYDNLKILTYWYILTAIPIALWLAQLSKAYKIIQIILLILLVGAGLNDALAVTKSAQAGGIRMATKNDLTFARLVNAAVKDAKGGARGGAVKGGRRGDEALILTSTSHDNPLSLASGRNLYMGYEGWLWTYGIDYGQRLEEITTMYKGTDESFVLIKARHINYIAIGPQERDRFKANEKALRERFPLTVNFGAYILLKVTP